MPKEEQGSWQRQLLEVARAFAPPGDEGRAYSVWFETFLRQMMFERKIVDWRATKRNSIEDRKGVDYWLVVGEGKYPFQITSDWGNAWGRKTKHPNVYVIQIIDEGTGDLKIEADLWRDIQNGIAWYKKRWTK